MHSTPLGLYIHFPWCIKKCPYCDFNSHALKEGFKLSDQESRYIETLKQDLKNDLQLINTNNELQSIFLGGGTPSLFSGKSIRLLIDFIADCFDFFPDIEITLEANPGTLEHDSFEQYLNAGINRLSLGIQSFNPQHLKKIGRIHTAGHSIKAIQDAKKSGFDNINLDIMFGLPNQNLTMSMEDCQQAIGFNTNHLSFYQLTLEPNTLFHNSPPAMPDEDLQFDMQQTIADELEKNGYERYEVSAYAKPDKQCRHNVNYWEFGDYLGIGAGAHSKLTFEGNIHRIWKQKNPKSYMQAVSYSAPYRNVSEVPKDEILFESLLNSLRLKNGIEISLLEFRTGMHIEKITQLLEQPLDQNLVTISDTRLKCTDKGYLFIDEILQSLLKFTD